MDEGAGLPEQFWQAGIEVFVDRTRLGEARAIADEVVAGSPPTPREDR